MAVSAAILIVLMVSVFSIAAETTTFVGDTDTDAVVQTEVNRAYSRLAEVLRKSGWSDAGGTSYPRVINGGTALQFRLLYDADGNGYAFDAATRQLEWNAKVFTVRLDVPTETLAIWDDTVQVRVLGRHIQSVSFATYIQDNTLHLKEVELSIQASRPLRNGGTTSHSLTSSIHMRN